jgi:hypothetical protein
VIHPALLVESRGKIHRAGLRCVHCGNGHPALSRARQIPRSAAVALGDARAESGYAF